MRSHSNHLCLITATLLLSLIYPLFAFTFDFKPLIAQAHTSQSQNVEAEKLYEEATQQYRDRRYREAIQTYQQALAIYRQINNHSAEGATLHKIGATYDRLGEYIEALNFYQQALAIRKEIGDNTGAGSTLNSIGAIYYQQGNYNQALEFYQQALAIRQELGDRIGEGRTLNNLGLLYENQGQYSKALEFYKQALAIFQILKKCREEGSILNNLGGVYTQLGQYEQALSYYQQALVILREINDYRGEGATLHNIGFTYSQLEKYSQALDFYQQALATRQRIAHKAGAAVTLNNQGFIYNKLGKYSQALQSLEQALALFQKIGDRAGEGNAFDSIGTVYKNLNNYDKSLEFYQQSLAIHREISARPAERTTLSNIGALLEKQNQPELAIVFYKESINITEAIRQDLNTLTLEEQKTYTETVADTYRRLADLLLSQGRILEAQQVLELLKVQELRDFTRDTRAGGKETSDITTNPTEAEILQIHGTLIALGQKIEQCQQTQCEQKSQLLDQREVIAKEFEDTVRSLEQETRSRLATDKTFLDPTILGGNAEEIVSAQPGTILIYPLVLEDKLWILWAASGGITKSIEVPEVGMRQLSETVVKFRQLLQNPKSDITELKATGKQLYDWLIPESLQKELKENPIQNLIFSLDHVTRYIPMGAVFDGENYLVENYNISTIISANLTQMGDRLPPGTENNPVLALGLSDAVAGFNPLPNVPAELDAIVRQSSSDPIGIYPGLEFLNKAFDYKALRDNLAGHLILHIATHGQFVPGSAYESYLLLGNGEKLPIPDIQTLRDLGKIHLVVLSACETALGDTGQDGTEIAGLSSYFINGGVQAVMASLWRVDDESTRLLMEQFYNNLSKNTIKSPVTKAQALRQAQLSLMKSERITITNNTDSRATVEVKPRLGSQSATTTKSDFSHPYYWAPFILIGNSL
ncbi:MULTISPECIES: CHAT domain-containing protein [unclassified Coleofasciculus]|uniref:CHAT domain-containing protein n=1 Tax=unclassified Coleofasciculus TaxID=2692782 RepID=UPI001881F308|nr:MULTISPECIES: tetratricopeptide repeat protein [unclassified Coleofasciculus]MBE9128964.1 tetratricopeptide repeat protein [Coleofasciculus sp. LEGE 07081]MBE9151698.1 tetratricopeptide repeat protein [Coleofasciculus sp. LEGE 07092]